MDNLKNEYISSGEIEDNVDFKEQPQQQQKQRRTKMENHKRAHVCGCGKSYLSAAALYTHVKQKHDGINQLAPSQISVKTNNQKKDSSQSTGQNKGSIPRMADLTAGSIYSDISQFFLKNVIDSSSFQKIENAQEPYDWILDVFPRHFFKNGTDYFVILQQLESLINQLKPQNKLASTVNQDNSNKSDTPSNGKSLTNDTVSEKDSPFNKKLKSENTKNMKMDQSDEQYAFTPQNNSFTGVDEKEEENNDMNTFDVYDFSRDLRITSINRIISIFIINVSKLICPTGFTEILVLLTLFRKSLNEKADNTYASPLLKAKNSTSNPKETRLYQENAFEDDQQLKSPSDLTKQVKIEEEHLLLEEQEENTEKIEESSEFCSRNSGEFIGEFANTFITDCLPGYFENSVANVNELNLLGSHEEGMKNAYFILQLFINWMYVFKFSSVRISFLAEQEEQQDIIPFVNDVQGRKYLKYDYDLLRSLENESRNIFYQTSMSHQLQACLQKSSLNFLDRIQSTDNLDEQQDPSGIQSGVIKSFDDGSLFEKISHQQDTPACFMGQRSAMTSTTFGRFQGSTCNSTSYAQGGNSTTYFNQNTPLSAVGSTCFNINGQKILTDPSLSSPNIPSLCYTNFDQGYLGNVMLGQSTNNSSSCPLMSQTQFIHANPSSLYGSAYGQQLACQIQQVQQQYFYPQNSWNQSYLNFGGNEKF